jgi:hypothetical protein
MLRNQQVRGSSPRAGSKSLRKIVLLWWGLRARQCTPDYNKSGNVQSAEALTERVTTCLGIRTPREDAHL